MRAFYFMIPHSGFLFGRLGGSLPQPEDGGATGVCIAWEGLFLVGLLFKNASQPRILLVRLSAHGDVVLTMGLISAIRQLWPQAHIGWLVEEAAAPLLEDLPGLDALHVSRRKHWLKQLKAGFKSPKKAWHSGVEITRLLQTLKNKQYEVALDAQSLLKSAIWPWLAGIPVRIGFSAGGVKGLFTDREPVGFCFTHPVAPLAYKTSKTHISQEFLNLLTPLLPPQEAAQLLNTLPFKPPLPLAVSQPTLNQQERLNHFLQALPEGVPVIAMAPATQWASKHWPAQHWATLLEMLSQQPCGVLWLGSPADSPLIEAILSLTAVRPVWMHNLAGQTTLEELYLVLPQVTVMVGPDSAPLHMAAAVASGLESKFPVIIGLYGPTSPLRTGPLTVALGQAHHQAITAGLSCQPCHKRYCPLEKPPFSPSAPACMEALSPQQVASLVTQALSQAPLAV